MVQAGFLFVGEVIDRGNSQLMRFIPMKLTNLGFHGQRIQVLFLCFVLFVSLVSKIAFGKIHGMVQVL